MKKVYRIWMPNLSYLDAWESMKYSTNEVSTLAKNRTKTTIPSINK